MFVKTKKRQQCVHEPLYLNIGHTTYHLSLGTVSWPAGRATLRATNFRMLSILLLLFHACANT